MNILDTGTCESGISAGKRFYIQEFLQGKTFSQHLRDKTNDLVTVEKAFETVVSELVSSVDEHRVHTSDKATYVRFLSRQVKSELSTISQLPFLGFLANCQEIVTNGIPYRGLNEAVKIILSADHLNEEGPPIGILSDLGHWNFHGDNIIINDIPDFIRILLSHFLLSTYAAILAYIYSLGMLRLFPKGDILDFNDLSDLVSRWCHGNSTKEVSSASFRSNSIDVSSAFLNNARVDSCRI